MLRSCGAHGPQTAAGSSIPGFQGHDGGQVAVEEGSMEVVEGYERAIGCKWLGLGMIMSRIRIGCSVRALKPITQI
jgi:hypothetical protein